MPTERHPEEERAGGTLTHSTVSSGATDTSRAASLLPSFSYLRALSFVSQPFPCGNIWGVIDVE